MTKTRTKITKVFLFIVGGVLVIILGLALTLWIKSPGKADLIVDSHGKTIPGSISVIEKVTLGGQEQYLIIRGADRNKPVMLFLHGGPGSPEFTFLKKTNRALENDFVMVYWEQRGAGKSYSRHIPVESMNLPQFIADTRELSILLAKRFNKNKIYIMGHSWGSLLGILTAHQYPELYYAYFGIGQVCSQYKAERISFEWIKEQARKQNNKKVILSISKMNFPDSLATSKTWSDFLMNERDYVGQFGGGITHKMTNMLPLVKTLLNAKEYTFGEKVNYMTGSMFSLKYLWPSVIRKNLFRDIDSMRIPVYIFQGKYDYQTSYEVAKEFYNQLKAPKKEFFSFENSAHSPIMEEVDKFNSIVREKTEGNK
ncbi:MAG: alpha/beta hydrolase [Bacteroidota bacterium]|nr:alpha/beta hydrolase [Bacteroidota bacterium]